MYSFAFMSLLTNVDVFMLHYDVTNLYEVLDFSSIVYNGKDALFCGWYFIACFILML